MVIYSNGCSHTRGHCVPFIRTWPNIVMKSLFDGEYDTNPQEIISENILMNESNYGVGNDYIFHRSIETIVRLIDNNRKPDYVFIQWSGTNRRMYCDETTRIYYVNPGEFTEYGLLLEPLGSQHSLNYVFMMQEFLKSKNIPYYFFNYMSFDYFSIFQSPIFDKIDFDKFVIFGNNREDLMSCAMDYFKEIGETCDIEGHPTQEANFIIAENILKKINHPIINKVDFLKMTDTSLI